MFEGQYTLIKRQVAEFYEVTERTIDNLIEKYNSDLTKTATILYEVNVWQTLS